MQPQCQGARQGFYYMPLKTWGPVGHPFPASPPSLQSGLILEVGLARAVPEVPYWAGSSQDLEMTLNILSSQRIMFWGPRWFLGRIPLPGQLAFSKPDLCGLGLPHLGSRAVVEPVWGRPP